MTRRTRQIFPIPARPGNLLEFVEGCFHAAGVAIQNLETAVAALRRVLSQGDDDNLGC